MLSFAFVSGASIGGSLIIAIGAQNAFVLRQGLLRQHVFPVVLICALSDALLISAGVGGLGSLIQRYPIVIEWVGYAGGLYLLYFGINALRRASASPAEALVATDSHHTVSLNQVIITTLAITYLNPHVYLDTVVLLGSIATQYDGSSRLVFGSGAICASIIWFTALGYGAQFLAPLLSKPRAWQIFDCIVGIIMIFVALSLAISTHTTQVS